MREALIICPKADNAGKDLTAVRASAVAKLVEAFGGCTVRDAFGCWMQNGTLYQEPVWELITACDDTVQANATLKDVAHFVGREGEQLAVYARFPNGDVEIIDTTPRNAIAA